MIKHYFRAQAGAPGQEPRPEYLTEIVMRFENWTVKGFDRDAAVSLVRGGINPLPAVFLASRGMTGTEEAKSFLTENHGDILDPFSLRDMERAVLRIRSAMEKREKIAVFGDYDVDGMTASALLKVWFRDQGHDARIYIPGRADEGYGLNCAALEMLRDDGVTLVITVDCGITAVDEAEYAKKIG
ncbi:MAG: DHH family phosphoesterase, partial [Oscillospiraceae bacterium]|nr:DHH family phosphoesterase [Oscillospiraceae bacterium]